MGIGGEKEKEEVGVVVVVRVSRRAEEHKCTSS